MTTDAFEDPSSVVKRVIEQKDVYSGIIMKTLEASMSFDVIDSMVEKASKDSKSILSSLEDFMKCLL